ncbi:MAG: UTP--glucose-1-phosphate uridylyltransferase, partial [Gammaproteobacteria bacterium]|nr:UTP--glucose-1-phosphate uridylyltransferase [Gammaproteobacteria bacterium]
MPIKKYVLPVAGLGTRFLPATKAIPKEMLPIVDKPLIQYVVEEAVEAGATEIILVTHPSKRALEDHFDINVELERTLEKKGKTQLLERVRTILPENIRVAAVRQHEPLGLGHAVLCAKELVGNEPFGVILPDVLIHHPQRGCMAQMMKVYQQLGHSIIAVEPVAHDQVDKYGIVSLEAGGEEGLRQLSGIVEKPTPENAPSNLSVVGRYILPPRVMQLLEQTTPGSGGEIQ